MNCRSAGPQYDRGGGARFHRGLFGPESGCTVADGYVFRSIIEGTAAGVKGRSIVQSFMGLATITSSICPSWGRQYLPSYERLVFGIARKENL